jgi:hypothetical protein
MFRWLNRPVTDPRADAQVMIGTGTLCVLMGALFLTGGRIGWLFLMIGIVNIANGLRGLKREKS